MNREQWQKLPGKEKIRRRAAWVSNSLGAKGRKTFQSGVVAANEANRKPAPITLAKVSIQESVE